MRRGTTPTHTFALPFKVDSIEKLRIIYEQNDKTVLQKTEVDCRMEGNTISTKLSQEETLEFKENAVIKVQLRILTQTGDSLASIPFHISSEEILSEEVL